MADFLDQLSLSDPERKLVAGLGVKNALALAAMIAAAREDFRRLIGDAARADEIERAVTSLLAPEERKRLSEPAPDFRFGAKLTLPKDNQRDDT